MPQVKIEKDISVPADTAFKKIKELLENSSELKKLEPNLKVQAEPKARTLTALGQKIKGRAQVTEFTKGCHVLLEIELPWALAPFKALVRSKLEAKIKEIC